MVKWLVIPYTLHIKQTSNFRVVSHEIICPQCKGPITIARPFDPLVYAVDHIQSAVKHLTTTTAIGVLGCTAWSALFIYGQNTIYTVFGEEDAARLLLPPEQPYELPVFARHIHRFFHKIDSILLPFGPWRALLLNPWIHVTLPLIGPSLVLWRYDVGERLFNLVPSMVLAARLISEAFKGPKYRHQMVAIWYVNKKEKRDNVRYHNLLHAWRI